MNFLRKNTSKEYDQFVMSYKAFDWECVEIKDSEETTNNIINSYIRFYYVYELLKKIFLNKSKVKVMDVGPYPGGMVMLLKHFFGDRSKYLGTGLGFSEDYKLTMSALGVELAEIEMDQNFCKIHSIEDLGVKNLSKFDNVDCVLFLDMIEHLTDPVAALDLINSKMNTDGELIITTDNITSLGYVAHMIHTGCSPNTHPIRSALIFQGLWRPHYREYSKKELMFYLDYCGFELVSHQYFNREQGNYSFSKDGEIIYTPRFSFLSRVIKGVIKKILPHLKDHHVIHAKKKVDFSIQSSKRPQSTRDMNEWLDVRKQYGQL